MPLIFSFHLLGSLAGSLQLGFSSPTASVVEGTAEQAVVGCGLAAVVFLSACLVNTVSLGGECALFLLSLVSDSFFLDSCRYEHPNGKDFLRSSSAVFSPFEI